MFFWLKSHFEINWPLGMRGDKIWYGRTRTTALQCSLGRTTKNTPNTSQFSQLICQNWTKYLKKALSGVCSPWFRNWILFWKKWENTAPMLEKSLSITVKVNKKLRNSMCSKEKNHDDLICPPAYWPEDAVALEQKGVFIVMKSIQKEQ